MLRPNCSLVGLERIGCTYPSVQYRGVIRGAYSGSMVNQYKHIPFRIAGLAALAVLIADGVSCQGPETKSRADGLDAVMKVVHEYGRGRDTGMAATSNTTKPDEDDAVYSARIGKLLAQEEFAQLEKIAQKDRSERGHLIGGVWKIVAFYDGAAKPLVSGKPTDSDYKQQVARIKKWQARYPDSTTPRIALASVYLEYAFNARGTDLADKVSDAQWEDYRGGTAEAMAVLLDASKLKEKDPTWYYAMLQVAHNDGWDKAHFRELFDQAIAFEPGFYHYYRKYANYILPQWYGEPGELLEFAEEISERTPEPNGSMAYFWIVSSLACYCQDEMQALPEASYPKLKQGYKNVTRLFGTSNLNANRFAFMAATFKDQASAHEAFSAIASMDNEIWYMDQIFVGARNWADAPPQ
jgi:Domain of unknown function (DUF4034)